MIRTQQSTMKTLKTRGRMQIENAAKIKTVHVDRRLSLSVIRLDAPGLPRDQPRTDILRNITGVYGVRLDAPRNTLQVLYNGTRNTARQIMTLLRTPAAGRR